MKKRRYSIREYSPIWWTIRFAAMIAVIGTFWAMSWMLYGFSLYM